MLAYDKEFHQHNQRLLRQFLFEKRVIFLEGVMTDAYTSDPTVPLGWTCSPRGVIDQIIYLSLKNQEPINLIINSPGGFLDMGFSLLDFMATSSSSIHTIGTGVVASAAVPILAAGKPGKRYILPHTRTMIHLPEGEAYGNIKDRKIAEKQLEEVTNEYISIISRYTGKTKQEIEPLIDREHWMNAAEAKAFGLVDHVVTNFSDIGINLN